MDPNVPQQRGSKHIDTSGGGEPLSRARMLIEIAAPVAKGLPCPELTAMYTNGTATLTLLTIADLTSWARHFGIPAEEVREHIYTPEGKDQPILLASAFVANWHGWSVGLSASEPAGSVAKTLDPSDPAVATVLSAAGEPTVTSEDTPADVLDEVDDAVSDGGDSDG